MAYLEHNQKARQIVVYLLYPTISDYIRLYPTISDYISYIPPHPTISHHIGIGISQRYKIHSRGGLKGGVCKKYYCAIKPRSETRVNPRPIFGGPGAVPRGPWLRKKNSARHSQQNVSCTAQQGPYTNVYLIILSCPRIKPPQTATERLQRLLQPHREPLSPSCYTCSAGLGVTRLEFVRYGLLTEVWSVPPRPPRKRHENAKFAGRTRAERHESVAAH